jgi:hypothetical protein
MTEPQPSHAIYTFEGEPTRSLELIPLSVRYKLDCCEIKLHLSQWQALPLGERSALLTQACASADELLAYRALLDRLVNTYAGEAATGHSLKGDEAWRNLQRWPQVVRDQAQQQGLALPELYCWQQLSEADRHALFVLGRSQHSKAEFKAAFALFFKPA